MRPLLFALTMCALSIAGCGTRDTLDDGERILSATISHKHPKAAAYQRAEVWVAESFVSGKAVTDLKQPDTGIIIAKAFERWTPEGQYGGDRVTSRYSLRLDNGDNRTEVRFEIMPGEGGRNYSPGTFPPVGEMARIRRQWSGMAESLARALGGTVDATH